MPPLCCFKSRATNTHTFEKNTNVPNHVHKLQHGICVHGNMYLDFKCYTFRSCPYLVMSLQDKEVVGNLSNASCSIIIQLELQNLRT